MIKATLTLDKAKNNIKQLHKKPVSVTVNLGRNKLVNFIGEIDGVYPSLFTVSPIDKTFRVKTTYSYSEYLCGKIKLKRISGQESLS